MKHTDVSRRLDGTPLGPAIRESAIELGEPSKTRVKPLQLKPRGKTKVLPLEQLPGLLKWLECQGPETESAQLVFGLSFGAGLRVAEIAGLTWRDVTDPLGNIASEIHVPGAISKYGRSRRVPMYKCIPSLLVAFARRHPEAQHFALNHRGGPRNANALAVWFHRVYQRMGLEGCSSHSGRRSFITYLANNHGRLNKSLKDVQEIVGHARLDTTASYIDLSDDLHRLVDLIPWAPRGLELKVPLPRSTRTVVDFGGRSAFAWEGHDGQPYGIASMMAGDRA
jgi:integrase/recombinase XerD